MKIRLGFVSNSSSASFIVATKKDLTESFLRKKLTEYFKFKCKDFTLDIMGYATSAFFNAFEFIWHSQQEAIESGEGEICHYERVANKDFTIFYDGSHGISKYDNFLFGIEIDDEDFYLYVDESY